MPSIILALALFALFQNALMWFDRQNGLLGSSKRANCWDYDGTVSGLSKLPRAPDCVFVGSSLLTYPIWDADRGAKLQGGDPTHHHVWQSAKRQLGSNYSLAIGGAMMSDYYLLLSRFACGKSVPKTVVVDCSPRATYDSGLVEPQSTPLYKHFLTWQEIFDPELRVASDAHELADALTMLTFPMFDARADIQEALSNWLGLNAKQLAASDSETAKPSTPVQLEENVFVKSMADYKTRYLGINITQSMRQLQYLPRIARLCRRHGSQAIFVIMPLTEANKSLLPKGYYNQFKRQVIALAGQEGTEVVDLDAANFEPCDFHDSAHLNQQGAVKFLNAIVRVRGQDQRPISTGPSRSL